MLGSTEDIDMVYMQTVYRNGKLWNYPSPWRRLAVELEK